MVIVTNERRTTMAFPDVNPTDSVSTGTQRQVQGQEQGQQQTVIVNVHTGEKARKGAKPSISGSVYNQPKPQQNITYNYDNSTGSHNRTDSGDIITSTGAGNVTGRIDNSNVANGDESKVVVGKEDPETPPTPPTPPEPEPDKPTIPREDAQAGKTLALRLHSETASSYANNGNISNVFGSVNSKNAYSFFKEYDSLAKDDKLPKTTGAMHDSYDVWDTFNNINIKITTPAVEALLKQADGIGLSESDEFSTLETLNNLAKQKTEGIKAQIRTPDLSNKESVGMDDAIKALIDRMSQEYK